MKIAAIAATAGIALAIGLGGASLAIGLGKTDDDSQLRSQVTQLQDQLNAVRTSVNGSHRDLITCGDFQSMNIQNLETINLNYDTSGSIYATPNSVAIPLPSHCVNQ